MIDGALGLGGGGGLRMGGPVDLSGRRAPVSTLPIRGGGIGGDMGSMRSFKRGGKVKRTGKAKLHKGEQVLPAKEARKYRDKKRAQKR
jgi:hypothetical protein